MRSGLPALVLCLAACRPEDLDALPSPPERLPADDSGDSAPPGDSPPDSAPPRHANVVLILTDDQAYDTLWAMPTVSARLVPESVAFTRAYVTVPMCCPMRSSLLSGGWYPRDTNVLTNSGPMGGFTAFADADTLGTRLQAEGVATGMFGKYLNEYDASAPYVAPGWDTWIALAGGDGAYSQAVVVGGTGAGTGIVEGTGGEHITPFLFEQALSFVDAHADQPFFLYMAAMSPHLAGGPATEDLALYSDYAPRSASWNEADVSDKPRWLQGVSSLTDANASMLDANAREMVRNLASVDRAIGTLLDGLDARGVLDDTLIVFASDNGYLNGEHRLSTKGWPYEEAVHVPMYVRMPGVAPRTDSRLVQVNTDIAATVLDAFGASSPGGGISLLDAFADPAVATRDYVFIDNYSANGTSAPVWSGVVTDRYKYVEWASGETEIYDLEEDPHELESLAADPTDGQARQWASLVDEHRSLAITTSTLPAAEEGHPYSEQLDTWGGAGRKTFSLSAGTLPDGYTLGENGHLNGSTRDEGTFAFTVRVEDATISPYTGLSRHYYQDYTLTVGEDARFAPLTVARRLGREEATFTLQARPGVTVAVRASIEPALDGPVHGSAPVVAGRDGSAVVHLDGLRPDRAWHWVATFDGVAADTGVLPRAPAP